MVLFLKFMPEEQDPHDYDYISAVFILLDLVSSV